MQWSERQKQHPMPTFPVAYGITAVKANYSKETHSLIQYVLDKSTQEINKVLLLLQNISSLANTDILETNFKVLARLAYTKTSAQKQKKKITKQFIIY